MPRYEYRCRTCGDTFELSRPMAESAAPADCPAGHDDTVKLLSTVSVATGGSASAPAPSPTQVTGAGLFASGRVRRPRRSACR
ncbi:zinc ribbon domain-containing protein [Streptomyces sp. NPDC005534]|uniref:FmdB family zinc ribbon protein n=1 Tax=Streptomyces sp. NPDC005534 TaxID=3155714 RepID=UPI0034567586